MDSPVSMDSLTDASPVSTVPSAGMRSPGFTIITSPAWRSRMCTRREPVAVFSSATSGCRFISPRRADPAEWRARISMSLPVSTKAMIMAAPSK